MLLTIIPLFCTAPSHSSGSHINEKKNPTRPHSPEAIIIFCYRFCAFLQLWDFSVCSRYDTPPNLTEIFPLLQCNLLPSFSMVLILCANVCVYPRMVHQKEQMLANSSSTVSSRDSLCRLLFPEETEVMPTSSYHTHV